MQGETARGPFRFWARGHDGRVTAKVTDFGQGQGPWEYTLEMDAQAARALARCLDRAVRYAGGGRPAWRGTAAQGESEPRWPEDDQWPAS